MPVTSRYLQQTPTVETSEEYGVSFGWTNKIVAVAFWAVGWLFTYQVAQYIPLPLWATGIGSAGFQLGLTFLESDIWNVEKRYQYDERGRLLVHDVRKYWLVGPWMEKPDLAPVSPVSWTALTVDGLLNMAGIWIVVKILHTLPPAMMIGEMFNTRIPPITGWYAFVLCAILGVVFCGAPERLWHRR